MHRALHHAAARAVRWPWLFFSTLYFSFLLSFPSPLVPFPELEWLSSCWLCGIRCPPANQPTWRTHKPRCACLSERGGGVRQAGHETHERTLRMEGETRSNNSSVPMRPVATSHSTGAWVLELASWKWQFSLQIFCCCVDFSIGSSELRAPLPRTTTPNLPPLSPTYRFPTPPARKGRDKIDRSRLLPSWLVKQHPPQTSLIVLLDPHCNCASTPPR